MRLMLAFALFAISPICAHAFPQASDIAQIQNTIATQPIGHRIAYWAESFVGTPYDQDPQGEYVTKKAIVTDDRIDCMYHVFRSVELAISDTPQDAIESALNLRFITKGQIDDKSIVLNYDNRFQYAEDMILSGKWGVEFTHGLQYSKRLKGSRHIDEIQYVPKENISNISGALQNGDIIYFVKNPAKRVVGEIIGHIGIIKIEPDGAYIIHANGSKSKGGSVKKILLKDYASTMPFIGIMAARFK